jgi:hypothetical protein
VFGGRRRARDEDDDGPPEPQVPADDTGNWGISEIQRINRENRDTYRKMSKLWDEIQERLRDPWKQP